MKTTKEMIEVMEAYERGEQIEACLWNKNDWRNVEYPAWNWKWFDYRVKQKKKFVPFDTAEEFLAAQRVHGIALRVVGREDTLLRAYVASNNEVFLIKFNGNWSRCFFIELFKSWEFEDGTPCGKEV